LLWKKSRLIWQAGIVNIV